jgi:hypothetical protein
MMQPTDNPLDEIEEIELVPLALPLDPATVEWLRKISKGNDIEAAEIVASIIRAIREDDEETQTTLH